MLLNSDIYRLAIAGPSIFILGLFCFAPHDTEIVPSSINTTDVAGVTAWCSANHPISWIHKELFITAFGYCMIDLVAALLVGIPFLRIMKSYDQLQANGHIEFGNSNVAKAIVSGGQSQSYYHGYLIYSVVSTLYVACTTLIICTGHPVMFEPATWDTRHQFCTFQHDSLDWSVYRPCTGERQRVESCGVARYTTGDKVSFVNLYWLAWSALGLMIFVAVLNIIKVVQVSRWNLYTFVQMVYQDCSNDDIAISLLKKAADFELQKGEELVPLKQVNAVSNAVSSCA